MRLDFAQRAWYDKKYTGGYRSYRNLHSIKQEHRVTNGSPVRVRYWPATVMRRGRQPCATSRETSYRFDADDFSGNRNLHQYGAGCIATEKIRRDQRSLRQASGHRKRRTYADCQRKDGLFFCKHRSCPAKTERIGETFVIIPAYREAACPV